MKYWLILWESTFPVRTGVYHNNVWEGDHPALLIKSGDKNLINFWEISEDVYNKLKGYTL